MAFTRKRLRQPVPPSRIARCTADFQGKQAGGFSESARRKCYLTRRCRVL
jgi:hypothetical protein